MPLGQVSLSPASEAGLPWSRAGALSSQQPAARAEATSPGSAGSPAACSVSWQKSRRTHLSCVFSYSAVELSDTHRTTGVQRNPRLPLLINSLLWSYSEEEQWKQWQFIYYVTFKVTTFIYIYLCNYKQSMLSPSSLYRARTDWRVQLCHSSNWDPKDPVQCVNRELCFNKAGEQHDVTSDVNCAGKNLFCCTRA